MFRYILKRVIMGVITLFILTSTTFFLMKTIPGNPFFRENHFPSPEVVAQMNAKYGLDKSLPEQYMIYLNNVLQGDFGVSLARRGYKVSDILLKSAPTTIRLGLIAAVYALIVGITLGLLAALSRKRWINYIVTVYVTLGVSIPNFLLALLLIIVFCVNLKWFPLIGLKTPLNYVLPTIALSFYPVSMITRLTRSAMSDVRKKDYMTLAKSKGLSQFQVIVKHGLKNALLPVVTYAGPMVAFLMTGSFVIENLFTIAGSGAEMVSAVNNRDYSMIMGLTIMVGCLIVIFNILSDIVNAFIDPRIKLTK
jgi:ABC-type dipeptide/oligopeptide/nickel transport systems, permease components